MYRACWETKKEQYLEGFCQNIFTAQDKLVFFYLAFPEMATVQGVIDASGSYNSNNVNKISFWNMHYYLCKINTATFPLQIILSVKKKR